MLQGTSLILQLVLLIFFTRNVDIEYTDLELSTFPRGLFGL
ncbi:hypothetical protein [Staphylococcus sp. HMSC072H03]|nr:hypothetical protein [Staphylococcus sp. HMSC072H03]